MLEDIKLNQVVIEDKPMQEVYIEYQIRAEEIYGEKTIVIFQIGDFYEIYGFDLPELTKINHLRNLLKVLNYMETRKNKSIPHSLKNAIMSGFPVANLDRNIELMVNSGYTIIVIGQIGNSIEFNKNKERRVVDIISPSTYLNSNSNSNILLAIYLSEFKKKLCSSISYCDIIQGTNTIYEVKDDENSGDIIYKTIKILEPKEIIIVNNLKNIDINDLIETLEIKNYKYNIINVKDNKYSKYNKLDYQEHILSNIFSNATQLNIFEYLDLELLLDGRLIYIYLLKFLEEHNCNILRNLNKPIIYKKEDYISLDRDTIYRLNLLYNNENETKHSLLSLLDKTITNIGKRKFRNNLLQPIVDKVELNRRYDLIEYFIENNDNIVKKYLENIYDITKLQRKLHITKLTNIDLNKLYTSYLNINQLLDLVDITKFNITEEYKEILNNLINYIQDNINLERINRELNFNKGVHRDLDEINIKLEEYNNIYDIIRLELSKRIEIEANCSKKKKKIIDDSITISISLETKNGNNTLYLTEPKAILLKKYLDKHNNEKLNNIKTSDIKVVQTGKKNRYNIEIKNIENIDEEINTLIHNYNILFNNYFDEFLKNMYFNYIGYLDNLVQFIEDVDISYCNACKAIRYNYNRPIIKEKDKSYFKAKGIRHPIIERINTEVLYISNDIELGDNEYNEYNKDGMLIYGINSSGKSSLMKSIGLSIIMAQSGMYVSSKEFIYSPYKKIFTRIGVQDNIFVGRSSFTQEMYELRNIFQNADENSLVIGDEICNGTEENSALSLVASTIKILSEKQATFIFASHLHRLVELDIIKNIEKLDIKHLKITEKNGLIIYDRKLSDGNGSQEYGIMVAQTLDMPDEFIKYANNVRIEIKNEVNIFDAKSNRYNGTKYSSSCQICGENYDEIHHIRFQRDANKNKYVDDVYINDKYNLVSLCEKCHDKIHSNKIVVNKIIETSEGVKLDYEIIN